MLARSLTWFEAQTQCRRQNKTLILKKKMNQTIITGQRFTNVHRIWIKE